MARTWQPVERATRTALGLGIASAGLYAFAAKAATPGSPPSLLYPYLAAASVFITTCVWILFDVSAASDEKSRQDARRWAQRAFWIVFVVLIWAGMAGKEGTNAVRNLNWYLFGDPIVQGHGEVVEFLTRPFNYIAAFGNALALSTLVYIGVCCRDITLQAAKEPRVHVVLSAGRQLGELLVLASALMVTSTLSLYLLFGSAEQIEPLRVRPQVPTPSDGKLAQGAVLKVQCAPLASASGPTIQNCSISAEPAASLGSKGSRNASVMALVAGLSFTGALFILFMSCGSAVDRRIEDLLEQEIGRRAEASTPFSVKTWREEHGVADSSATQRVLQALALLAPALTGALTLVVS